MSIKDVVDRYRVAKDGNPATTEHEKDWQNYMKGQMKEHGIDEISDLSDSEKKDFFEEVDDEWNSKDEPGADGKTKATAATRLSHLIERKQVEAAIPAWLGQAGAYLAVTVLMRVLTLYLRTMVTFWKDEMAGNVEAISQLLGALGTSASERDLEVFFKTAASVNNTLLQKRKDRAGRVVDSLARGVLKYLKVGLIKDVGMAATAVVMSVAIGRLIPYLYSRSKTDILKDVIKVTERLSLAGRAITNTRQVSNEMNQTMRALKVHPSDWEKAMSELEDDEGWKMSS